MTRPTEITLNGEKCYVVCGKETGRNRWVANGELGKKWISGYGKNHREAIRDWECKALMDSD